MAFDPTTATPVADSNSGFDPSTARPVRSQEGSIGGPKAADPSLLDSALGALKRYTEYAANPVQQAKVGAHYVTGALAAIPAGLAGIASGGNADVVNNVQNALTYDPKDQGTQQTLDMLNTPLSLLPQGADKAGQAVSDATGSPALGTAVNTGIQALPMLLGAKAPGVIAKAPTLSEAAAATLKDTHDIGIRVTPEYAGQNSGPVAQAASMSGSETKLQQVLSKYNANGPVPAVIKSEIGIPPEQPLTKQAIQTQKASAEKVYSAVRKAGSFQPDQALLDEMDSVGDTRSATNANGGNKVTAGIADLKAKYTPAQTTTDASTGQAAYKPLTADGLVTDITNLRKAARDGFNSDSPETKALARAQQDTANALENFFQRKLDDVSPNLSDAFKFARTKLAKINTISDAFNDANGTVDVREIAKAKDNGVPLSGGLLKLANAYQAFPKVLQDPAKINVGSGSFVDKALQFGGALHGNIPEIAAGAIRPLARARVNSDPYQAKMASHALGNAPGMVDPRIADLLARIQGQVPRPTVGGVTGQRAIDQNGQ